MEKLISVIVPIYNSSKYLTECIDSIINQSYKNLEIILINDGSTDNSLEICKKYQRNDKRIVVIDKKNSGVSDTRNQGIINATADYIMFVDSDDILSFNFIEILASTNKNNNYDVIIGNYIRINNLNKELEKHIINNFECNSFIDFITNNYLWEPWGKLIKKDIIKENFNINIHIAEDILFWCENGKNINYKFVNNYGYFYRDNPNSIMKKRKITDRIMSEYLALNEIIECTTGCSKYFFMIHYINKTYILKSSYVDVDNLLKHELKNIKINCLAFWKIIKKSNYLNIISLIELRIKIFLLNF